MGSGDAGDPEATETDPVETVASTLSATGSHGHDLNTEAAPYGHGPGVCGLQWSSPSGSSG